MFGQYDAPVSVSEEGISLSLQQDGDRFTYQRTCMEDTTRKTLLSSGGRLLLNPVEPLNKPKNLSPYLLIRLEESLMVGPGEAKTVFLTFPVEIGAYFGREDHFELVDIFTLAVQKYTLYGEPSNGFICRYWKSGVFSASPDISPLHEGVLELRLVNTSDGWVDVSKVVFNAYGMKVFYNAQRVVMKGTMRLRSGNLAETGFEGLPPESDMIHALEVYTAKKLSMSSSKFVMEFGL